MLGFRRNGLDIICNLSAQASAAIRVQPDICSSTASGPRQVLFPLPPACLREECAHKRAEYCLLRVTHQLTCRCVPSQALANLSRCCRSPSAAEDLHYPSRSYRFPSPSRRIGRSRPPQTSFSRLSSNLDFQGLSGSCACGFGCGWGWAGLCMQESARDASAGDESAGREPVG